MKTILETTFFFFYNQISFMLVVMLWSASKNLHCNKKEKMLTKSRKWIQFYRLDGKT